ncbi:MAG: PTS mannose/fructose/sorbose transporter subunit IIAB [Clostridium perfringens]|nr:PTS mannose/fructose/sorbose transporter subunit IIAB [Clostridium perfringens]
MNKKILIASHGKLAGGIQSSLNILADKGDDVEVINAYITDEDYTPQIVNFIESIGENEQGIIFTDLFGGSVNQKAVTQVATAKKENIFIISNANLAIVLSLLFSAEDELTEESIKNAIDEAQVTLVSTKLSSDDEDDFFMITQIRVDDRLIHGQVAVVWTKELNAPLLVVANDEAAKNEVMQMTLKMAVPNGMKLLIRSVEDAIKVFNDPRGKDKRMFVIVNSVSDATKIAKEVSDIESVNVANAGRFDKSNPKDKVMVFSSVQLNPDELKAAKELSTA